MSVSLHDKGPGEGLHSHDRWRVVRHQQEELLEEDEERWGEERIKERGRLHTEYPLNAKLRGLVHNIKMFIHQRQLPKVKTL